MTDANVVLFGYSRNEAEVELLSRRSMPRYPVEQVRAGPEEAAVEALAYLAEATGTFVVHLDVDVIDFVGLPVADVPQINAGLTFREALACLEVFASSRRSTGLVVTEFNPDHADEEGETAMALVQGLVGAVSGGITRSLGQDTSRRPTT